MSDADAELAYFVRRNGIALSPARVANRGLAKADAVRLLEMARDRSRVVLGGDVYERVGGAVRHTGESWCTQPRADETRSAHVERSAREASDYLTLWPDDESVVFAIVIEGIGGA